MARESITLKTKHGTLSAFITSDKPGIKIEFKPDDESKDVVGRPGVALCFNADDETELTLEHFHYGLDEPYRNECIAMFAGENIYTEPNYDEESIEDYKKRFTIYGFEKDMCDYVPLKAYNRCKHAFVRAEQMAQNADPSLDWIEIHCENDHVVAVVSIPDGKLEQRIDILNRDQYPTIYDAVYPLNVTLDGPQVDRTKIDALTETFTEYKNSVFSCPCEDFLFNRIVHDTKNRITDKRVILIDALKNDNSTQYAELTQLLDTYDAEKILFFSDFEGFSKTNPSAAQDFIKSQLQKGTICVIRDEELKLQDVSVVLFEPHRKEVILK